MLKTECRGSSGAPAQLLANRPHLSSILEAARTCGPIPVAVAYPCDSASLESALAAAREQLIVPTLVGPRSRIEAVAADAGLDLAGVSIRDSGSDPRLAAADAVALCRTGTAAALMKGSLHTDDLLAAAVAREGLRTARRVSHVFVLDLPNLPRPLLVTDCVVNFTPNLPEKRDITQNVIDLAHAIGIGLPRVAILSAVETVTLSIPSTVDAAALCKMADRKQITGAVLDGPLAFDNAISERSARNKGIDSPVAGQPDILLVPDLEAGNIIYKQFVYMSGAECAGIVLGTTVPVILTSRSDSVPSRIASCALAVLQARGRPAS